MFFFQSLLKDLKIKIFCLYTGHFRKLMIYNLLIWPILVQMISNLNSMCRKLEIWFDVFCLQVYKYHLLEKKCLNIKIEFWVVSTQVDKFEIIWMKIGQVIRLQKDINFSESHWNKYQFKKIKNKKHLVYY